MKQYGILGRKLGHSFSPAYFKQKIAQAGLENITYQLFELSNLDYLRAFLVQHPDLAGFTVTIPYKQTIMPLLTTISPESQKVGAVNVVKIERSRGKILLHGYNTDVIGFEKSLLEEMPKCYSQSLIIGNGGAAQAAKYVLTKLEINYNVVSRNPKKNEFNYTNLSSEIVNKAQLIINATPLGMFPDVETFPLIDYQSITNEHLLFDMVYNPAQTLFLQKGQEQGAKVVNGLKMLHYQADEAWEIWEGKDVRK